MPQDLEADTCALTSTLRKTYCPLPVSHHQSYSDAEASHSDLYAWRGGGSNPDGMVVPAVHHDTLCGGTTTTRGAATKVSIKQPCGGGGGGAGDLANTGTFPRKHFVVVGGKAVDSSHVYETPK